MFTEEFIIESCRLNKRKEQAHEAWSRLSALGLKTKELEFQLDEIVKEAMDLNAKAIGYMMSFIPKELKDKLTIRTIHGAYATDAADRCAFCTEFVLYLQEPFDNHNQIKFVFDSVNNILYHDLWSNKELVSKYVQAKPKDFNSWLYI